MIPPFRNLSCKFVPLDLRPLTNRVYVSHSRLSSAADFPLSHDDYAPLTLNSRAYFFRPSRMVEFSSRINFHLIVFFAVPRKRCDRFTSPNPLLTLNRASVPPPHDHRLSYQLDSDTNLLAFLLVYKMGEKPGVNRFANSLRHA